MYKVKIFDFNSGLMETFKEYPLNLYAGDKYYTKKEDQFRETAKYLLVYSHSKVVGRLSTIVNTDLRYKDILPGLIGHYECNEDNEAADLLFKTAENYFKSSDIIYVIGPMNGSTWYSYRLCDKTNNSPFFLDNHNKPWYSEQFVTNNYETISGYSSLKIKNEGEINDKIYELESNYRNKGIQVSSIKLENFKDELQKIYQICIRSFNNNFLYSPVAFNEFLGLFYPIKNYIDPEYVLIAEDDKRNPVGFIFAINNIYEDKRISLIIKTVGILPEANIKGLGSFLVRKIHYKAFKNGYKEIIHAHIQNDNPSMKILFRKSQIYRTYKLYGKAL